MNRLVVDTFQEHRENGLFTLRFPTLDHLAEYISRFRSVQFLDASAFELFNLYIKKSYRTSSMRTATRMSETVNNMGRVMKRGRMASDTQRNLPSSSHNQRKVRLREELNHIAGGTNGNMGE